MKHDRKTCETCNLIMNWIKNPIKDKLPEYASQIDEFHYNLLMKFKLTCEILATEAKSLIKKRANEKCNLN